MARKVKKIQAPAAASVTVATSAEKSRRIVIIAVAILLGVAIIGGVVAGIVIGAINASYLMYCNGVGIDEGVANYLASCYKSDYMASLENQGIAAADLPAFWNQKVHPDVATTFADYLNLYVEGSIKNIVAANSIFDSKFKLTENDRIELTLATEEILTYRHSGSKAAFNEAASEYGFDYDDFVKGTEMLYKAAILSSRIFSGTESDIADAYAPECEEIYSRYTRASVLFIRTNNRYAYDENGDYIIDEKGNYVTVELSEEERAERLADIEKLKGIASGQYEFKLYDDMWKKYEKENNAELHDCYFYEDSELTMAIQNKYPLVLDTLYYLEEYQFGYGEDADDDEINSFVGYVFVYRDKPAEKAYLDSTDTAGSFDDFFDIVASETYSKMLEEVASSVEIRTAWDEIDAVIIPYNVDYIARF